MHILYFHQHFSTPQGSTGIRSYQMAQKLIASGHQVTMVCGSFGPGVTGLDGPFVRGRRTGQVDGITVIEFELSYSNADPFLKRSLTFLKFALASIRVALGSRYDIAFATTTPLTAGIPGIFARWLRRKPFVFEVRDLWPELPRAMGVITNPVILSMMSALEWASYRSANRCIGLAGGISQGIAKRGVAESRITTIPNGCDLDLFATANSQPWRPDGVKPGDLMAVFSGTHGKANGLDAVVDAAEVLHRRGRNDIKIVLIGTGMLKDALITRTQAAGLSNVVFLDPVPKDRLSGLLGAADLGIQSLANIPAFYFGTSPNKFFDYLASSLPVLTNYPGWVAELVEANQCGFAVPPDDRDAFANALEAAADDRARLGAMAGNARALAESQFDRNILADRWVSWVTNVPG
jgi:glycosyltransferase involved in cell wall biosynthesis